MTDGLPAGHLYGDEEANEGVDGDMQMIREQALANRRRSAALTMEQHIASTHVPAVDNGWPKVVVALRDEWFRDRIVKEFTGGGFRVVAEVQDGAAATGLVLAERPSVLVVQDRLPYFTGIDVIHRVRASAPHTVVAVQVLDGSQFGEYLDAGAHAVFTRRKRPIEVARLVMELARCPRDR
jgi:CheY-like chemotaxis protein